MQRGEGKLRIITPLAIAPVVSLRGVTLGVIEDVDLKIATGRLCCRKIFNFCCCCKIEDPVLLRERHWWSTGSGSKYIIARSGYNLRTEYS
jgi:hypothetical protein